MKFGDNLRNLRKSKKISQEELADKIGVSRQSVSKWECGESYPEMNNILYLCDIFRCKINDLVHESFEDIDSLDEEIKMSVVKLKKEKQERVRILSRIISVIAIIGKIASIIGIAVVAILILAIPIIQKNINVTGNIVEVYGHSFEYETNDNSITLKSADNEQIIQNYQGKMIVDNIIEGFSEDSRALTIGYIETALVFLVVTLVLIYLILKHLELLFKNIYNGDTPFTLENVNHIKLMAKLMIAVIIVPNIVGGIMYEILAVPSIYNFELFDIIQVLFLFSLVYIFEYGYEIQLDSKGIMYDN